MVKIYLDISTQPNFGDLPRSEMDYMQFLPTYFVILRIATKQTYRIRIPVTEKNARLLSALKVFQ